MRFSVFHCGMGIPGGFDVYARFSSRGSSNKVSQSSQFLLKSRYFVFGL